MNRTKLVSFISLLLFISPLFASAQSSGLTQTQINAIIGLLYAFNADQSVIVNVQTALGGTPVSSSSTSSPAPSVSSISPTTLSANQPTTLILSGSHFTSGATVLYTGTGNGSVPSTFYSPNLLSFGPYSFNFGAYTFSVKNPDGQTSQDSASVMVKSSSLASTGNAIGSANTSSSNTTNSATTGQTGNIGDPGKGLWMPPAPSGYDNLFVVDPGNSFRNTSAQVLPGTINLNGHQLFSEVDALRPGWRFTMDYYKYPPTNTIVSFKPGNIVSLRYRTAAVPSQSNPAFASGTVFGTYQFAGPDGAGTPGSGDISASLKPGDFSDPKCTVTSSSGRTFPPLTISSSPSITHSVSGFGTALLIPAIPTCIIPPNTDYYLNFRMVNKDSTVTSRVFDGTLGRYVFTPLTDAEVKQTDCTSSTIWCPIILITSSAVDVGGFFGGVDPFAASSAGSNSSNGDPGFWTGLWVPKTLSDGTPNPGYGTANPTLVVADQSFPLGVGGATFVPGCINQLHFDAAEPCGVAGFYSGRDSVTNSPTIVTMAPGRIVSIRYRSSPTGAAGTYRLLSVVGSSVPYNVSTSLSTIPGDFNVSAICQASGNGSPEVSFGVYNGRTYCPITPDTTYYVNLKLNTTTCEAKYCSFSIEESGNLQTPLSNSNSGSTGSGSSNPIACTLPDGVTTLPVGYTSPELWYKNGVGACASTYFVCSNGALTPGFSPAPTITGSLFMTQAACGQ